MKPYELLKDKLGKEKRITRLITVRPKHGCPLVFNEMLVYSTLIWRDRKGTGFTAAKLSLLTGLHQSVTLPKVLRSLAGYGLVVKTEKKRWVVVPPPESLRPWFSWRSGKTLQKQLDSNWIAVPAADSPLTNLQAAIVAQILLGKKHKAIARFIRVSVRSVSRTAKMLSEKTFKKSWFQDCGLVARRKRTEDEDKPVSTAESLAASLGLEPDLARQLDRCYAVMRAGGIKDKEIMHFWRSFLGRLKDPNSEKAYFLLLGFSDKFAKINTDHKANVRAGKAVGPNCYRLLCNQYGVTP